MNRIDVINKIIDETNAKLYLEIGIERGEAFNNIKVSQKIGVDPSPLIYGRNIFEEASDEYFKRHEDILEKNKIDLAFIDGLHTYEQSLRDVDNCLKYLNKGGVIVMHDCNPVTESRAAETRQESKELPGFDGISWNGDVWKTIVNLRSLRDDLNIVVLDCDEGLGIITFGRPESMLGFQSNEVENMTYKFLENDRKNLLNLKEESFFDLFMKNKSR